MGSSVIRNLIGILALIALSFLIGITTADNAKSAVMIIFAIISLIGIIVLGKHVWITLFILIPIGQAVPIYPHFPIYNAFAIMIFSYWIILSTLGYTRFTWRKLLGADLIMLIIMIYMAITFFRHPGSIKAINILFSISSDQTSVTEYPLCIATLIVYLTYSCIPIENARFVRVVKWGIIIKLLLLFGVAMTSIYGAMTKSGSDIIGSSGDAVASIKNISQFSTHLCVLAYASAPHNKIFVSPQLIGVVFAYSLALFAGFRKYILYFSYLLFWIAIIRKEYLVIILGLLTSVLLLSTINTFNITDKLPYTVQRTLSIIPFMNVSHTIKNHADGSTDWRLVIWDWALDKRTHQIKNYVAGDGFAIEEKALDRVQRALIQADVNQADQRVATIRRFWHSGFIKTLQEIGIIGVSLTFIFYIYAFIQVVILGSAIRHTSYFKYFILHTFPYIYSFFRFYLQTADTAYFLVSLTHMGFLKVFRQYAIENGDIKSRKKKKYIPLLIQQYDGTTSKKGLNGRVEICQPARVMVK